jgi:Crp-like helix-turn-helix domain
MSRPYCLALADMYVTRLAQRRSFSFQLFFHEGQPRKHHGVPQRLGGIEDSRGALLRASFSHQDIADLVGASRPRVTEHLAQLEREHLVIRQGRQLIVRVDKLGNAITIGPLGSHDAAFVRGSLRAPSPNNEHFVEAKRLRHAAIRN